LALPRAAGGAAAGAARAARLPQVPRRALQLQPARSERGGLERRPLRRVARSRGVARIPHRGGLHRDRALLPPAGAAAGAAAVAGERVEESVTLPPPPPKGGGEKDAPLTHDIRLLGRVLGDTIRHYEGEQTFRLIEEIRQLAVASRRLEDE